MPTTLTFIDPKNNNCKVYHIDGTSSLYGRIGCTLRNGVVKSDTERSKLRKGYVRTMLVRIPHNLAPYNAIKMLRWNAQKQVWVGYGCFQGYYRPLGFEFDPSQAEQFAQYQISFRDWNWSATKY